MKKLFLLTIAGACNVAAAQTPANNPMPDGSRDMYLGLGVLSAPKYEGARARRVAALPLVQAEWSTGIFISGSTAGMHLSSNPKMEFGPLLSYQAERTEAGVTVGPGGVTGGLSNSMAPPASVDKPGIVPPIVAGPDTPAYPAGGDVTVGVRRSANRLYGMDEVKARVVGGGFFNYYLTPRVRLTSNLLAGAGNKHDGVLLALGVQQISSTIGEHHALSLSGGVTLINSSYGRSYFGVTATEALRSGNRAYRPDGGIKDVHVGLRWNWTLSPSWILSTGVRVARLQGDAKHSPLVERPTTFLVSSGLAYRY